MEALSFVLSLSFFPPKESYSVVQDAEERREKGVTMNSILKFSVYERVLIGFFFSRVLKKQLFWHIKARENTEREQRKEKKRIRRRTHKHRHARERKFLTRFWSKKKCLSKLHQPFLIKTSESTYFVGKFSLTTNDSYY